MENSQSKENITQWIKKQTILVTGGTGQVGKILLYKLLTLEVPKIYILVRSKRGKTPHERTQDMLQTNSAFTKIREKNPNFLSRIVTLEGDTSVVGLGLSADDRKELQDNVTVVFNSAASVSFEDPFSVAVLTNLRSAREMMILAHSIKKLEAFVHVSTAFANLERQDVEEQFYPPLMDWRAAIKAAEMIPESQLAPITIKLQGHCPNTYILTKRLAEIAVRDLAGDLPVTISRPAIVIGPHLEPDQGWMDSFTSPMALLIGGALGAIRVYYGPKEISSGQVPGDLCVYGIIAAAYRIVKEPNLKLPIYNTPVIPIVFNHYTEGLFPLIDVNPLRDILWEPHAMKADTPYKFYMLHILLHVLPGIMFDIMFKFVGIRISLLRIYRKYYSTNNSLRSFQGNQWIWKTDEWNKLTEIIDSDAEDKKNFNMKMPTPYQIIYNNMVGYKRFNKESLKLLPEYMDHRIRLRWMDKGFKAILLVLFIWIFPTNWMISILQRLSHWFVAYIQNPI